MRKEDGYKMEESLKFKTLLGGQRAEWAVKPSKITYHQDLGFQVNNI